jgi:hypothetical protein
MEKSQYIQHLVPQREREGSEGGRDKRCTPLASFLFRKEAYSESLFNLFVFILVVLAF